MYRYLDRTVASLGTREQFLIFAMRTWVKAVRAGQCSCRELQAGFDKHGISEAMADFGMLMMTLDQEGLATLRFGAYGVAVISPDEARLLALFATAQEGPLARLKRVAATFVIDSAVTRLAQAADFVATALTTSNTAKFR